MNKKNIFRYIKTIFWTIIASFLLVMISIGIIRHQVYEEQSVNKVEKETVDDSVIAVLIDKNKYLEAQSPEDYKINVKLGTLYELKGDYKNAEIEYKTAIEKAPFNRFSPRYKLALLYLRQNRLDESQVVMDGIEERPDKKLIEYKADIYNKLGDKYYDKADYEEAGFKYQKSLRYYKIINSKKQKLMKGNLASAYIYLADEKVNKMQIDDAITYLQMAKELIDAPIIKYKLAILLTKTNPDLSHEYFKEVFKKVPEIINYEEYLHFLSDLTLKAEATGDNAKANLYKFEIKKIKDYSSSNILSIKDLSVELAEGQISSADWNKKYKINFKIKLKNISKYSINSLFIETVFLDRNQIIETDVKQIVDSKSILKRGAESPIISLKTATEKVEGDKSPKELTVQIYASKTKDSYRILLKEIKISENVSKKMPKEFTIFGLKFHLPHF